MQPHSLVGCLSNKVEEKSRKKAQRERVPVSTFIMKQNSSAMSNLIAKSSSDHVHKLYSHGHK